MVSTDLQDCEHFIRMPNDEQDRFLAAIQRALERTGKAQYRFEYAGSYHKCLYVPHEFSDNPNPVMYNCG
jgi:hypothetical protein